MKKFFLKTSLLGMSVVFLSCSQDSVLLDSNDSLLQTRSSIMSCNSQIEANKILAQYLILENSQYKLAITEEEAVAVGVTEIYYQGALKELEEANEFIRNFEPTSDYTLELTDPQKAKIETFINVYMEPYGSLRAYNQTAVQSNFVKAPVGLEGIEFNCMGGGALLPFFLCGVYSRGQWQKQSAMGTAITNTKIEIKVYDLSSEISMSFQTSDSNGGVAAYQGYKK